MAWEDRTPAQKRQARRQAVEYARTDDNRYYIVTTANGTQYRVHGINSARVVAGRDGTIQPEED